MPDHGHHAQLAWIPVHRASFGLIHGSILALSRWLAMDEIRFEPFEAALFGKCRDRIGRDEICHSLKAAEPAQNQ